VLGAEDPDVQQVVDRETLRPLLAQLPARARRILLMSFFHEKTQTQIGAELGVSQVQVSRLPAAILAALRQRANCAAGP
jgi:RNA polymerase sigma-B factor